MVLDDADKLRVKLWSEKRGFKVVDVYKASEHRGNYIVWMFYAFVFIILGLCLVVQNVSEPIQLGRGVAQSCLEWVSTNTKVNYADSVRVCTDITGLKETWFKVDVNSKGVVG